MEESDHSFLIRLQKVIEDTQHIEMYGVRRIFVKKYQKITDGPPSDGRIVYFDKLGNKSFEPREGFNTTSSEYEVLEKIDTQSLNSFDLVSPAEQEGFVYTERTGLYLRDTDIAQQLYELWQERPQEIRKVVGDTVDYIFGIKQKLEQLVLRSSVRSVVDSMSPFWMCYWPISENDRKSLQQVLWEDCWNWLEARKKKNEPNHRKSRFPTEALLRSDKFAVSDLEKKHPLDLTIPDLAEFFLDDNTGDDARLNNFTRIRLSEIWDDQRNEVERLLRRDLMEQVVDGRLELPGVTVEQAVRRIYLLDKVGKDVLMPPIERIPYLVQFGRNRRGKDYLTQIGAKKKRKKSPPPKSTYKKLKSEMLPSEYLYTIFIYLPTDVIVNEKLMGWVVNCQKDIVGTVKEYYDKGIEKVGNDKSYRYEGILGFGTTRPNKRRIPYEGQSNVYKLIPPKVVFSGVTSQSPFVVIHPVGVSRMHPEFELKFQFLWKRNVRRTNWRPKRDNFNYRKMYKENYYVFDATFHDGKLLKNDTEKYGRAIERGAAVRIPEYNELIKREQYDESKGKTVIVREWVSNMRSLQLTNEERRMYTGEQEPATLHRFFAKPEDD